MASCNAVTIRQRPEKGILGGPLTCRFSVEYKGIIANIKLEQRIERITKITPVEDTDLGWYWSLFNILDMLFFLFDGEFYNIQKINIKGFHGDGRSLADEKANFVDNRVSYYKSADFVKGSHSSFLNPLNHLNGIIFNKWVNIVEELDISVNIAFYSLSEMQLPIDGKIALLIEAFEPLADLAKKPLDFSVEKGKRGNSTLAAIIETFISCYGGEIFNVERTNDGYKEFVKVAKDSRNRVMHAKSRQNRVYFSGEESVLYAIKFSYLYRRVLLEILGIDYSLYKTKLQDSVARWNSWEGVSCRFLTEKLKAGDADGKQ
ncbi:MAG: hypothetical protein HUJ83_10290 [Veillonella sp.]|nr:hypothetical protein [Veillonella sp.]